MTQTVQAPTPFVRCAICGEIAHVLLPHLKAEHALTGEQYVTQHPGQPLWSAEGAKAIKDALEATKTKATTQAFPIREKRTVDLFSLFPDFYKETGQKIQGSYVIYDKPAELTPPPTPDHIFPEKETLTILAAIERSKNNAVYLSGSSGTGKTSIIRALAALCNAELLEFNADEYQQRSSLVGNFKVDGSKVYFDKGILPTAMERGSWLLVNEIDTWNSGLLNVLKPVLEYPSRLPLPEMGGHVVIAHPDFRIFATANTWGRGDDRGVYAGSTKLQSDADIRRWPVKLSIQYLPKEREINMVLTAFPVLSRNQATKFVEVAGVIREAYTKKRIDKTLSAGEILNWIDNWLTFSKAYDCSVHEAADMTFIQTCDDQTIVVLNDAVVGKFGQRPGGSK